MNIGILALQGDFVEHIALLNKLSVTTCEVRLPRHLESVDALIIPGGESTTLSRLMSIDQFREPLKDMARKGKAIWGTCAGMIMMAGEITEEDPVPLQLMDIGVRRNAFGRQIDSFEQDLKVSEFGAPAFHAIFIRAPEITRVGQRVKVLASLPDGSPVAVQEGKLLATSFHPELSGDTRFHRYFLDLTTREVS